MPDEAKVGIVGAGSVAMGTAALLHDNGHDPMLWSPSGKGTAALAGGGKLIANGAIDAAFRPRLADGAQRLVRDNDVLILALPAYGHKAVMDSMAPHVRNAQHVIISSHASLGAIYLMQLLARRGVTAPVTAWGTTAVTARRLSGSEVGINTVRRLIDLCTVPDSRAQEGLELCRRLFGNRFQSRDGLLAISLSNLNPQNHMGIALGNMTRMERGETWSQGRNVTPNVGRLLEALDQERLAIACALELDVRTVFEHFHLSYHVPVASISEMNQQMHARGTGGTGPATANSRYVVEDVPYGLVVTAALGELVGRPARLHDAGTRILSAMYGRDFAAENELLNALDLQRHDIRDLQRAARTGLLQR